MKEQRDPSELNTHTPTALSQYDEIATLQKGLIFGVFSLHDEGFFGYNKAFGVFPLLVVWVLARCCGQQRISTLPFHDATTMSCIMEGKSAVPGKNQQGLPVCRGAEFMCYTFIYILLLE